MTASHVPAVSEPADKRPVTYFGPDFPFAFDDWIKHPAGLGKLPAEQARHRGRDRRRRRGRHGGGLRADEAGAEAGHLRGGADRRAAALAVPFEGAEGVVAELGGMRFPISSTAFFHYLDQVGLETTPFPNPADVGDAQHGDRPRRPADLRREARGPAAGLPRGGGGLARGAGGGRAASAPCRTPSARATCARIKEIWNRAGADLGRPQLLRLHRHLPTPSCAGRSGTARCSARSASAPAAGTPTSPTRCWRSCASSYTNCDEDQRLVIGGVEQMPRRLWKMQPDKMAHWPRGTSLETLHAGAPRPGVVRIAPAGRRPLRHHRPLGRRPGSIPAVLVTCQSWLLTTHIDVAEQMFSQKHLDGARPHPLHAVGQDLRHGRPAVLEGHATRRPAATS